MIRKLVFPALAIALLGGCVTSGYDYRSGQGDYYYGQPQVEYRDYGTPYGYGNGWNFGFGLGYGGFGGYPYYGGYGYGGYYDPWGFPYGPYSPYWRHRHRHGDGHHGHGDDHAGNSPPPGDGNGHRPPPWRDPGGGLHPTPPGHPVPMMPRERHAPEVLPRPDRLPTPVSPRERPAPRAPEPRMERSREPDRAARMQERELRRKVQP